jgi:thiol-disulfide isomerase/thioredoxin
MSKKTLPQRIKNNKFKIVWMFLLGLGLILVGTAVVLSRPQATKGNSLLTSEYSTIPQVVNYPAPEIKLTDLSSQNVILKDYQNKIVLVNNWATWCPPCKAEMPTLETYYQAHADEGFLIIAIESGESLTEVTTFVEDYAISFPVWIDQDSIALDAFSNWNLPSSYVIDRNGIIRLTWTGEISLAMLEKFVTPLLKE